MSFASAPEEPSVRNVICAETKRERGMGGVGHLSRCTENHYHANVFQRHWVVPVFLRLNESLQTGSPTHQNTKALYNPVAPTLARLDGLL